jgi:hypothetical protein
MTNAIIIGTRERPSPPMAASSPAFPSPNGDAKAQVPATGRTGNIVHGDCVQTMRPMHSGCVDFILTDPPYLVRYRSRDGRSIANDDNAHWLRPAFAEMYRLLKHGSFCVSFYGWNKADQFIAAWRAAGFRIVGHIVFRKRYASSVRFLRYEHEAAYLPRQGRRETACDARRRCARLALHRQPPSPDRETGRCPEAAHRGLLSCKRTRARPLLRFGLDARCGERTRPTLCRHRTRRGALPNCFAPSADI